MGGGAHCSHLWLHHREAWNAGQPLRCIEGVLLEPCYRVDVECLELRCLRGRHMNGDGGARSGKGVATQSLMHEAPRAP